MHESKVARECSAVSSLGSLRHLTRQCTEAPAEPPSRAAVDFDSDEDNMPPDDFESPWRIEISRKRGSIPQQLQPQQKTPRSTLSLQSRVLVA